MDRMIAKRAKQKEAAVRSKTLAQSQLSGNPAR